MPRSSYQIFNGLAPKGTPKAITLQMSFVSPNPASQYIEFLQEETEQIIESIQSLLIDNTMNPNPLTIVSDITLHKIVCPPNSFGAFPIAAPDKTGLTISTPVGAGVTPTVIALNVPIAPFVIPIFGAPSVKYAHFAGAIAGSQLKVGAGILHTVTINTTGATVGAITLQDTAAGPGGNTIAVITPIASSAPLSQTFDVNFTAGLFVSGSGATMDITVCYT